MNPYTHLHLADTAGAVEALPAIGTEHRDVKERETGIARESAK